MKTESNGQFDAQSLYFMMGCVGAIILSVLVAATVLILVWWLH